MRREPTSKRKLKVIKTVVVTASEIEGDATVDRVDVSDAPADHTDSKAAETGETKQRNTEGESISQLVAAIARKLNRRKQK